LHVFDEKLIRIMAGPAACAAVVWMAPTGCTVWIFALKQQSNDLDMTKIRAKVSAKCGPHCCLRKESTGISTRPGRCHRQIDSSAGAIKARTARIAVQSRRLYSAFGSLRNRRED